MRSAQGYPRLSTRIAWSVNLQCLTAGCLEIRSLEVVEPGRDGTNRAPARNVNVVVKLIERALLLWVTADTGADFDESGRCVDPVTMRGDVGQVRVGLTRCDRDEHSGGADRETYSKLPFHSVCSSGDASSGHSAVNLARTDDRRKAAPVVEIDDARGSEGCRRACSEPSGRPVAASVS